MAHPPTIHVYESRTEEWLQQRRPRSVAAAETFAARERPDGLLGDMGCGPGWYSAALDAPVVALDAARAMLEHVPSHAAAALRVQADLAALPLARGALAGAWASRSYVHLDRHEVPLALADLHRALAPQAPVELHLFEGDADFAPFEEDDFGGRMFSLWPRQWIEPLLEGAGFAVESVDCEARGTKAGHIRAVGHRARTLSDTVGPDMRLLLVGLNPSLHAADAGVPFAGPSNRFWPAARTAGLAGSARDPRAMLLHHGVGMTDLVKRATRRAQELSGDEYQRGVQRLTWLVEWLQPAAVCFVGLAGWRASVDRRAVPGWQPELFAGRPAYVMPSTSGLNASSRLEDLTDHLRAAAAGP